MEFLLAIGVAMFAGLFLSRLTSRLKLPDVTSYLVAGLLVGPLCLGRLGVPGLGFSSFHFVESMGLVCDAALGFIAFSIGSEFRISALRRTGKQATVIAIVQALTATLLVDGALFAVGDVHAVMGDGAVGGSVLEIPANITFTIEVIPGKSYEFPIAEDDSTFCIIATEPTLDAATESVTGAALTFMRERIDLEDYKIIMLMSLVGDLQVSQVVDPEMTVRFMVPKKYLDRKEF